jgi:hypothetical protein
MSSSTRTIDGHTYEVWPLPAWTALELFHSLTKALAPAVAGVAATEGPGGMAALSSSLERVLVQLPAPELTRISKQLLSGARVIVNGSSAEVNAISDVHFQGRVLSLLKVVAFAIEVNFPDFFGAFRGVASRLGKKAAEALNPIAQNSSGPAGG